MKEQISLKLNEIEDRNKELEIRGKSINQQIESLSQSEKEDYIKYENSIKNNKIEYEAKSITIKELNFGKI
jgi:hypothetical protein